MAAVTPQIKVPCSPAGLDLFETLRERGHARHWVSGTWLQCRLIEGTSGVGGDSTLLVAIVEGMPVK